jgi:uncharacterized membrane protein HdeD (DUF308 family)
LAEAFQAVWKAAPKAGRLEESRRMTLGSEAELREITWGWWLLVLVGVLSVVAGVIVIFKPGDSLATLAVIAGIFLLVDGILELVSSFVRSTRNRGLTALIGALTAIVGVLLIRHPIGGVTAIALLIGIWLIAVGVVRLASGFDEPENRTWYVIAGALELIAGIVIVAVPNIGYATLAILVAIGFILNGLGMIALGWAMRQVRRAAAGA